MNPTRETHSDEEIVILKIIEEYSESREGAEDILRRMRVETSEGENPEEMLRELGLEPDYIHVLI